MDANTPRQLDDCIERVAQERPPAFSSSAAQNQSGTEHFSLHIAKLLEIMWADVEFWKAVNQSPSYWLPFLVSRRFRLHIPMFEAGVWKSFTRDEQRRKRLFRVIASQPWRLSSPAWQPVPVDAYLVEILKPYVEIGVENPRHKLASMLLPDGLLRLLSEVGARLANDAKWCLKHPEEVPPPSLLSTRGKPPDVERARIIERLACLVLKYPHETDDGLAKLLKKGSATGFNLQFDTLRKMAGEAKQLAELRDGIVTTRHVDQTNRGRRPSRKRGTLAE